MLRYRIILRDVILLINIRTEERVRIHEYVRASHAIKLIVTVINE